MGKKKNSLGEISLITIVIEAIRENKPKQITKNSKALKPILNQAFHLSTILPIAYPEKKYSTGKSLDDELNQIKLDTTTLLNLAIIFHKPECAKALIKAGADVNYQTKTCLNPLATALTRQADVKFIEYLITQGANLGALSENSDRSALYYASLSTDLDYGSKAIPLLLEKMPSAEIERTIIGEPDTSPLFRALYYKPINPPILDLYLNHIKTEPYLSNALYYATLVDNRKVTKKLLSKGATLAYIEKNRTAFEYACEWGNQEVVEHFLKAGYKINSILPFRLAIATKRVEIVKLLVQYGADLEIDVDHKGRKITPADKALALAASFGLKELIDLFLEKGVDIKTNSVAIYFAAAHGHWEIVEALINAKADVNTEFEGYTPLAAASEYGHTEVVKKLLAAGADANKGIVKPISMAIENGHPAIVNLLVNAKAELNFNSATCERPLALACEIGHLQIVKKLVDHGAEINFTNLDDDSPLSLACAYGEYYVVRYLLENGADLTLGENFPIVESIKYNQLAVFNEVLKRTEDPKTIACAFITCIINHQNQMLLLLLERMKEKNIYPANTILSNILRKHILNIPSEDNLTQFRLTLNYFPIEKITATFFTDTLQNSIFAKISQMKSAEKKSYAPFFIIAFEYCKENKIAIPESYQQIFYNLAKYFNVPEQYVIMVLGLKFFETQTNASKKENSPPTLKMEHSFSFFNSPDTEVQTGRRFLKEEFGKKPEDFVTSEKEEEQEIEKKVEDNFQWVWGGENHSFSNDIDAVKLIINGTNEYFYCPPETLSIIQKQNLEKTYKQCLDYPKFVPPHQKGISKVKNLDLETTIKIGDQVYKDCPLEGEMRTRSVLDRFICASIQSDNANAEGKKATLMIPIIHLHEFHSTGDKNKLKQYAKKEFSITAPKNNSLEQSNRTRPR